MRSIKFNNLDSYEDYQLILKKKDVSIPIAKTNYIDVPGRRNPLDLTDFFGATMYERRTLTFEFKAVETVENIDELYTNLVNELSGQEVVIIDSDLPDYCYNGRITEMPLTYNDLASHVITIIVDCEPFKTRLYETRVFASVNGNVEVICHNLNKEAIPRFVCSDEIKATFNGKEYIFENGENIRDIVFTKGHNIIEFEGVAEVEIYYQEGGL